MSEKSSSSGYEDGDHEQPTEADLSDERPSAGLGPSWKREPIPDFPEQGQLAAIAEVAVLDIVAFLATVAAVGILIVDAEANRWWLLGGGLAFALTVISAARLIPMWRRYRATRARWDTS
jgi:hypothetical protein